MYRSGGCGGGEKLEDFGWALIGCLCRLTVYLIDISQCTHFSSSPLTTIIINPISIPIPSHPEQISNLHRGRDAPHPFLLLLRVRKSSSRIMSSVAVKQNLLGPFRNRNGQQKQKKECRIITSESLIK